MVTSVNYRNLQSEEDNGRVADIYWRRSPTPQLAPLLLPPTPPLPTTTTAYSRLAEAYPFPLKWRREGGRTLELRWKRPRMQILEFQTKHNQSVKQRRATNIACKKENDRSGMKIEPYLRNWATMQIKVHMRLSSNLVAVLPYIVHGRLPIAPNVLIIHQIPK